MTFVEQVASAQRSKTVNRMAMLRTVVTVAAAIALSATTVTAAQTASAGTPDAAGSVVDLVLRGSDVHTLAATLDRTSGVDAVAAIEPLDAVTVTVSANQAAKLVTGLRAAGLVDRVEADPYVSIPQPQTPPGLSGLSGDTSPAAVTPQDVFYGLQWGLPLADVDELWEQTTGSPQVTIAILDSGVDEVSELAGRVLPGWDFVNDDADPADDNGHGTQSAVVAAGAGNAGGTGAGDAAGVCWQCTILPVKVLDSAGTGSYSYVAAGIVWAVDQGADIVNLSLGGKFPSTLLDDAVAYATAAGVPVFAAAGNDGVTEYRYPAASPGAVSVAGSTDVDARYSWSNYGTWVDLAAPGCNVAQNTDDLYYWFCGTSSATPFVSGVAALLQARHPQASSTQIEQALVGSAAPVTGGFVSSGRLDADDAAAALSQALTPPSDTTAPTVSFTGLSENQTVRGQLTVTVDATDDVAVVAGTLLVDGAPVATVTNPPWQAVWDSTTVPDGPVEVTWQALDAAGNEGTAQVPVTVDNTAPTPTFATPFANAALRGQTNATVSVPGTDGAVRAELWTGTTRLGVDRQAPWSVSFAADDLPQGPLVLRWRVFDAAGNVAVVQRTVSVDTTAPQTTIQFPNPGRAVRGVVGVRPEVTDASRIVRTQLFANGTQVADLPYKALVVSWDTAAWGAGQVWLVVRSTDAAGNVASSPARSVWVDRSAPTISFTSPRPNAVATGELTVTAAAGDDRGLSRVQLLVNGTVRHTWTAGPYTTSVDTSGWSGVVTLRLRAWDRAGNYATISRNVIAS